MYLVILNLWVNFKFTTELKMSLSFQKYPLSTDFRTADKFQAYSSILKFNNCPKFILFPVSIWHHDILYAWEIFLWSCYLLQTFLREVERNPKSVAIFFAASVILNFSINVLCKQVENADLKCTNKDMKK